MPSFHKPAAAAAFLLAAALAAARAAGPPPQLAPIKERIEKLTVEVRRDQGELEELRRRYLEERDVAPVESARAELRRGMEERRQELDAAITELKELHRGYQLQQMSLAFAQLYRKDFPADASGQIDSLLGMHAFLSQAEDLHRAARDDLNREKVDYEEALRAAAQRRWIKLGVLVGIILLAALVGGGYLYGRRRPAVTAVTGYPTVPGAPAGPADGAADLEAAARAMGQSYAIVRELGRGGMGVVFEAVDLNLGRKIAIKQLREELVRAPEERRRLIEEARTVASLRHPGIVAIYNVLEGPLSVYLVFELLAGKPLSEVLAGRGRLPLAEARRVLASACAAVGHAHAAGIVHRDLKPANIMLGAEGVKIMDFGIARRAADREAAASVEGSPEYMAPEQLEGRAEPRSDVYALGACFYEMLAGEPPFRGAGPEMLSRKLAGDWTPLPPELALPPALAPVLAKALHPSAPARYATPAELAAAAEAAA